MLKGKTTFEMPFNKSLSYSHLKSFGCLAHVHDHGLPKEKFRARGRKCVFLGYPYGKKRLEI